MEKRVRSPNYPAISLPAAIERAATLYRNQHTHAAPREVLAKNLGFSGISGPSATTISTLHKYGLIEKSGDSLKISDRALQILHPHSPDERKKAIIAAANEPPLFAAINERFPGAPPNDELLRNFLIRAGFSSAAVSNVILSYRETADMVAQSVSDHDSSASKMEGQSEMQTTATVVPAAPMTIRKGERSLGRYDFEGGGFVQILTGGEVDTSEALAMAQTLLNMKRQEIEARNTKPQASDTSAPEEAEDDPS